MLPAPLLYLFPRLSQHPEGSQLFIIEGVCGAGIDDGLLRVELSIPLCESAVAVDALGESSAKPYSAASLSASIFINRRAAFRLSHLEL